MGMGSVVCEASSQREQSFARNERATPVIAVDILVRPSKRQRPILGLDKMVFVDITGPKGARTVAFPIAELNIGSASDCDLQLDHGDVAPHHVSVIERGGHAVVLNLAAPDRAHVDGKRVTEATVLTETSELVVGPFRMHFRIVELAPDTIQTQTVRQPASPPIPMSDSDIEILSTPYAQVHSSELFVTPPGSLEVAALPLPSIPEAAPPEPSTLPSQRLQPVSLLSQVGGRGSAAAASVDPQVTVDTDPSIPVASIVPLADDSSPVTNPHPVHSLLRASDDPVEAELLRAIVENEDATEARTIYADWLEERGAVARAEYMRLLTKLPPGANPNSLEPTRLRVLGKQIANPWRAMVALRSTPIERCPLEMIRGESKTATPATCPSSDCPKTWGALDRWLVDDLRNCRVCEKPVHYVSEVNEARRWASHGNPVVVDPSVWRSPDDLECVPPSSHYVIEG